MGSATGQVIKAVIVDDEASARRWLRTLCDRVDGLEVVAECATAREASLALRNQASDVLFLDIRLGPHTGFQVLNGLSFAAMPHVVFVTAHEQYAVKAFDRAAVDYLLKPVREERFRMAIDRIKRIVVNGRSGVVDPPARCSGVGALADVTLAARLPGASGHVIAEREGSFHVLDRGLITVLEADRNYILVWCRGDENPYRMRGTIYELHDALGGMPFMQINRSVIVNMTHSARIERDADSHFCFVMHGSDRHIRVGRSYHSQIAELIRGKIA
ncbi:MAG: response regulator transcription factor [Steroidobacteraceae bacterium]